MVRIGPDTIGVDEVGRGAWAGPFVVAAVYCPNMIRIPRTIRIRDSKTLTPMCRQRSSEFIQKNFVCSIQSVSNGTLDDIGIQEATRYLFKKAVEEIAAKIQTHPHVFFDGRRIFDLPYEHSFIINGDAKYGVIAAASIVAKVARDHMMDELHTHYPAFNFRANKGYGTREHQEALLDRGATFIHRMSYRPMSEMRK